MSIPNPSIYKLTFTSILKPIVKVTHFLKMMNLETMETNTTIKSIEFQSDKYGTHYIHQGEGLVGDIYF